MTQPDGPWNGLSRTELLWTTGSSPIGGSGFVNLKCDRNVTGQRLGDGATRLGTFGRLYEPGVIESRNIAAQDEHHARDSLPGNKGGSCLDIE